MGRQDWAAAAPLFRQALARDPRNPLLHYNLAICAAYLELRDEAVREFQWVLANGPAGSQEVEAARQWLIAAGVLQAPREATSNEPPPDETTGDSGLAGRVLYAESGAPVPLQREQLHLIGLPDTPTKEQRYVLRTDQEGRFEFKRIVPGPYRLTNRVAGQPTWRLKVELEPGSVGTLDLTPDNSTKVRDDFPGSAR